MYTSPGQFSLKNAFSNQWIDFYYEIPSKEPKACCCCTLAREWWFKGSADLSAKKIVYIQTDASGKLIVSDTDNGGVKEEWAPIYRKKHSGEACQIAGTCLIFTPPVLVMGVAYNALRHIAIPFLLLYHIGKVVYTLIKRPPEETRTSKEIIWDHFIEYLDQTLSLILELINSVAWRVLSLFAYLFIIFETVPYPQARVGRKLAAYCESMANRKISLLRQFKTEKGQQLDQPDPREKGTSLYHAWWSVVRGPMEKFKLLSSYHAWVTAGCFLPIAVAVLQQDKIVHLRSDSGKIVATTAFKLL